MPTVACNNVEILNILESILPSFPGISKDISAFVAKNQEEADHFFMHEAGFSRTYILANYSEVATGFYDNPQKYVLVIGRKFFEVFTSESARKGDCAHELAHFELVSGVDISEVYKDFPERIRDTVEAAKSNRSYFLGSTSITHNEYITDALAIARGFGRELRDAWVERRTYYNGWWCDQNMPLEEIEDFLNNAPYPTPENAQLTRPWDVALILTPEPSTPRLTPEPPSTPPRLTPEPSTPPHLTPKPSTPRLTPEPPSTPRLTPEPKSKPTDAPQQPPSNVIPEPAPVIHCQDYDYHGNLLNGLKNGYGIVKFLIDQRFAQGDFQNDCMNGSGRWISAAGNVYVGNFCNDQFSGHGVFLEQHTGNVYDGEYHNNLRHGHGRYYWRDGHMYDGQWANDQQHGEGTYYRANATVQHRGTWEKGNFIG
ncbi:MAG: hypothetical protein LBT44_04510 [Clostridiales bacterium]|jgi:hypothetical protein|nr:hypothetical protein [Clostridiales bacterium]MDR3239329.1 hypothetical protein [Clostridiales bacterium]